METVLALAVPCFAILMSPSARAVDFSGHWTGTGKMTQVSPFLGNKVIPCSKVELAIEHVPALLTIRSYVAVCGGITSDWGPAEMEIRGTQVFEDGEETGTLIDDTLKTLERGGGVQYAFNLRLQTPSEGQQPVLETYYGVRNLTGTIVIEGNLAPQIPATYLNP